MQQLKQKTSRTVKRTLALFLAFVMVATSLAMNPSSADAAKKVNVKKVAITKPATKTLVLKKGKTYTLKTKVTVNPNKKNNKGVTFQSSKSKVVSVNKKGVLKAKANGTAKVTVTSKVNKKKKATITVKVGTPITKVTLNKKKLNLNVGKSGTLKVTYKPKKPSVKKVNWKSSKPKIAKVSKKGKVTGVKAGTANITATAADGSGKKATCKVTVKGDEFSGWLVEDFSSYDVGYDWTKTTRKNKKDNVVTTKMTVIADPEAPTNKVLEVKPAGYDANPAKTVKLPEGDTLNDYKGVYIEVRVLEGSDLANKAAVAFFDKPGKIDDETNFFTFDSDENTAASIRAKDAYKDLTDEEVAKKIYNNRFHNTVPMASREDDSTTEINERFMPNYSETFAKDGKDQEPGFGKGWKKILMPFELKNIPDDILALNEFDIAVGANYNDDKVGTEEECVWYLNCIYLDPKTGNVPVSSITVESKDDRVRIGGTIDMEAKVAPDNARNKAVTWSSSDTSKATVDAKTGKVTGVANGEVEIIATSVSTPAVTGRKKITVFTPDKSKEDYVVDLSKIVTDEALAEAEATGSFTDGVLSIQYSKRYASLFIDLGEDKDLNGYSHSQITGESNGQLTFELYQNDISDKKTNDLWYENAKFSDYPFYDGSMTNRTEKEAGTGIAAIPGKETLKSALKGDLSKIRYIRISTNDSRYSEANYAAESGTVKIHEIRFIAPLEDKKDFPVSTLPINENFEGSGYNVIGVDPANVVDLGAGNAKDGSKALLVKGSDNKDPHIVISNKDGQERKRYQVSAWVKGTPGSEGKNVTLAVGSNYNNTGYFGYENLLPSTSKLTPLPKDITVELKENEWTKIETNLIYLEAGQMVEVVLKNYDGAADFYVDLFEAKLYDGEVGPGPSGAKDIEINAANVKAATGSDAVVTVTDDGKGFNFKYGEVSTYGAAYNKFDLVLAEGTKLSDYQSVTFTYEGIAGDLPYKDFVLLAANKSEGLPGEIDFAWETATANNALVVSKQKFQVNGMDVTEVTLEIDPEKAALLTESTLECSLYLNMSNNGGETEYKISNIKFNAKVATVGASDIVIDPAKVSVPTGSDAVVTVTDDGKGFNFKYGEVSTYGAAYNKFDLVLAEGTKLTDYQSVTFTYQGIAGDIGYKDFVLLAANKSEGLPNEIDFAWETATANNALVASQQKVQVNGMDAIQVTLLIDEEIAALLTENTLECSLYLNMDGQGGETEYEISNIKFKAIKSGDSSDIVIDPAKVTVSTDSDAIVSVTDDGKGFNFKYGEGNEYGSAYNKFDLVMPSGNKLTNYESVTFTYTGIAGDIGYKSFVLLAANKSEGLPKEIDYAYETATANNALVVSKEKFSVNGSDVTAVTLQIDPDMAALLTESSLECSLYINMSHSGGETEYEIFDISFNLK